MYAYLHPQPLWLHNPWRSTAPQRCLTATRRSSAWLWALERRTSDGLRPSWMLFGDLVGSPRFPLNGSLKGDIGIDIDVDIDALWGLSKSA